MKASNERFVRLRNMANLPYDHTNANFLQALMDCYPKMNQESSKEMQSLAVKAYVHV